VDVGISATAVEKKLDALGMTPGEINGVIVTHAHSDHCAGAAKFCKKYSTVLYSHPLTLNMLKRKKTVGLNELSPLFVRAIEREEWVLGDIHIQNFDLPHTGWLPDGKDHPGQQLGFVFRHQEKKLVYLTDLGTFPEEHFEKIRGCDGYFIESNHDEDLQKNSGRDPRLIKRNLSDYGHLSNKQTAQILKKAIIPGGPTTEVKVLLTHLSEHCNTPELVMNTLHIHFRTGNNTDVFLTTSNCFSLVKKMAVLRLSRFYFFNQILITTKSFRNGFQIIFSRRKIKFIFKSFSIYKSKTLFFVVRRKSRVKTSAFPGNTRHLADRYCFKRYLFHAELSSVLQTNFKNF
jgi:phosphoribosyl 1,2-cyclic phosphodiesterase